MAPIQTQSDSANQPLHVRQATQSSSEPNIAYLPWCKQQPTNTSNQAKIIPLHPVKEKQSDYNEYSYMKQKKSTGVHAASAIKDKDTIEQIRTLLLSSGRYGYRNWMIFLTGINTGRRCGDILKLKIGQVYDGETSIRKLFT